MIFLSSIISCERKPSIIQASYGKISSSSIDISCSEIDKSANDIFLTFNKPDPEILLEN